MKGRVSIHICTKDRHSEVAILLQSLRTQTFQDWDLILLDDASGTPLVTHHPTMALLNRIKLEGHKVKILRNDISQGVCAARNKCIDEDKFKNEFTCRLDDDCVPERDYLERLYKLLDMPYCDMASGLIPLMSYPELIRENKFIKSEIINEHKLDKKGNLIQNNDECAFCYLDEEIKQTHQFRTNCMYKSIIHEKVRYPTNLTKVGFREEGFFSLGAILNGYKIFIDMKAVAYHFQTLSGGCRQSNYAECVKLDDETFRKWILKNFKLKGDFLQ